VVAQHGLGDAGVVIEVVGKKEVSARRSDKPNGVDGAS